MEGDAEVRAKKMRILKNTGALRSKTGCRTCRIRRVKCDENEPECRRCASTGRKCEWFPAPIPAAGPLVPESRSGSLSRAERPRPAPSEFPQFKIHELRGFEFFQRRTAPEMCPVFELGFWDSVALQLSRSDPAVLRAAVALGTLHEMQESLGMPVSKDRVADPRHRFAVLQYNMAINTLTERAKEAANGKITAKTRLSPLPACLIFTHIDLLRGHYEAAVLHIRSAFAILEESHGLLPSGAETMIRTAFKRLELQSIHFDDQTPFTRLPIKEGIENLLIDIGRPFRDIAEGKERVDRLAGYTYKLVGICEQYFSGKKSGQPDEDTMKSHASDLLRMHGDFIRQCDSFSRSLNKTQTREKRAMELFQMHTRLARILLSVNVCKNGTYDSYIQEFEYIIRGAKAYIAGFARADGKPPKLPTFSTDWGIIFPLTVTTLKCRDPAVRRDAMALLEVWPHREGLWDSSLAIVLGRQVIELESSRESAQEQDGQGRRVTQVMFDVPEDQSKVVVSWKWETPETKPSDDRNFKTVVV
ncbi:hypothetical protein GQ53DRAFT_773826 [Thozetella sp. PMI_491]|nr:hypothetical protein GQ53DRAFT_773826 [Thozetella sp. PMI_491]